MAFFNPNSDFKGEPKVLLAADTGPLSGVGTKGAEKLRQLQILEDGYKKAKAEGAVTFEPDGTECRALVSPSALLQIAFLLPNGDQLGWVKPIGLSNPSTDPRLHEIRYSEEEGGFWLTFSALKKGEERNYSYVLVSERLSGSEAIINYYNKSQKELFDSYRKARELGSIDFGIEGRVSSDFIGSNGYFKVALVLPTGEQLGKKKPIGLPATSIDPRLHEVRYSEEEGGFWVIFSALNKREERNYSYVLVSESLSGSEAVIKYKTANQSQKEVSDSYRKAREFGSIDFGVEGRSSPDLIGTNGQFQIIFPLPNGEQLRSQKFIRLPVPSIDPRLHEISYSEEEGGFWLTFSALNKREERNYSYVLISESLSGSEAVIEFETANQSQKEVSDSYRKAREFGSIDFGIEGRLSSDLIGIQGGLQRAFRLPNGEQLGKKKPIGLPATSSDPRLYEIRYSEEEGGFWLTFSALNKREERNYSYVLISESLSGGEAVIEFEAANQSQKEVSDSYRNAREFGSIDFGIEGRSSSDLIGPQGRLQRAFLLPNGEQLGKVKSIGLSAPSTDPKLHEITYSKEDKAFWLTFSALNKNDILCFSKVLISETLSGPEAILKVVTDREDKNVPAAFKRSPPTLPQQFRRNGKFTEKDLSSDLKKKDLSPTFPKGEAFEQIAGVLLASLYPDEKVIPQYCLKVAGAEGYFGVRADYKIGNEIFEIMWGGAEDNIHETYEKHHLHLKDGLTYNVLTLVENDNLQIPYSTFDEIISKSPLKDELTKTLSILSNFVAANDVEGINLLRDYLYSALKKERDCIGDTRLKALYLTLSTLNETPADQQKTFMKENAKFHFQNLEAFFEYEGELYRSFITPKAFYEEAPEQYSVIYRFGDLTFESEFDRDIAVMLDLSTSKGGTEAITPERTLPNSKTPYITPTFTLPTGESFSTVKKEGFRFIASLSELKELIHFQEGYFEFGLDWIRYYGNRA